MREMDLQAEVLKLRPYALDGHRYRSGVRRCPPPSLQPSHGAVLSSIYLLRCSISSARISLSRLRSTTRTPPRPVAGR